MLFFFPGKRTIVPLDKEFQWVNVKQKPLRKISAHSGIIKHIQELFRYIQNPV